MKTKKTVQQPKVDLKKIGWILRIGLFGTFLGHGIFALQLKQRFLEMLAAMTGITGSLADKLMYTIGAVDVVTAILAILKPIRILLIYAAVWGFMTAVARPVAGDPIWDFVERWANWAVPLALLYIRGFPKNRKELFS